MLARAGKFLIATIPFVILALLLWRQVPVWVSNWKTQGTSAPQSPLRALDGRVAPFPPVYDKWIVVFWATWCGPCEIELSRLKEAVEDGSLDASRILAVSIGETINDVRAAQETRKYPFAVLVDENSSLARKFGVKVTPTVVFLNPDNRIDWISSGLSPSLVLRAKSFLAARK